MLMVLKSLRSPEFCNIVWYVIRNSIYVLGRAMVILRILGCLLLICRMLRNWFSSMSAPCLSLGSLRPEGGVVLGLDHSHTTYVQLSIYTFLYEKYFKVLKYYSLHFVFACHLIFIILNIYVFVNTYIWLCVWLSSSSILRF